MAPGGEGPLSAIKEEPAIPAKPQLPLPLPIAPGDRGAEGKPSAPGPEIGPEPSPPNTELCVCVCVCDRLLE